MGKKFIISEDERNRILGLHETAKNNYGTVISEQYAGVAFGAEQNGLRIKKVEATEQVVPPQPVAKPTANQTGLTPKQPLKPTLEIGGVKYYVPNLTDASLDSFTNLTGEMSQMDARNFYENLGVRWMIGGFQSICYILMKDINRIWIWYTKQKKLGMIRLLKDAPYAQIFNAFQSSLSSALLAYLK
jgi:hypothetical protein